MSEKDVHAQLQKKMQEAWDLYTPDEEDMNIPEPDLSFLDKETQHDDAKLNLDFLDVTKKKTVHFSKFGKVAAILLAILITSSAITIFMNSDVSYGVKSVFQNVKHFLLPKQEATVDTDGTETLTIEDWKEIKTGKKMVNHLYEPGYLPPGYLFKEAVFKKADSVAMVDYRYENEQNSILVSIQEMKTSGDVYVAGEPYKSSTSGKTMYVEEEKGENQCGVTYLDGQNIYTVSGPITKGEAVKIIENLKKMR